MENPKRIPAGARVLRVLAIAVSVLLAFPTSAQVVPPGFGGFKHVRWGADDGAPVGINQIAQTPDGYLWLAGDALIRFDGESFERIDWAAGSHRNRAIPGGLFVARDGTLWVGLVARGGVAVYRNGALQDLHMPDPPRTVDHLAQTPDGTIWAASGMFDKLLWQLRDGRWTVTNDRLGLPEGAVMALLVAPNGALWAALAHQDGASGALAMLAPGARRFREVPARIVGRPKLALDRHGALWLTDLSGTRMLADARGAPPASGASYGAPPGIRMAASAFDLSGGLWGTTSAFGMFHVSAPGAPVRHFGAADGLTSDFTYAPFVDREGNAWIATEGGIDQFRRASAVQDEAIPADPINGLAMTRAPDGSVYIVSQRTLFRIDPGQPPRPIARLAAGDLALCTARDGGAWLVQAGRALRIQGDRTTPSPAYLDKDTPSFCAEDRLGRLWVALFSGKLIWRDPRGWHPAGGALAKAAVWDMTATPSGDLAFSAPPDLWVVRGARTLVMRGRGSPSMVVAGMRDVFLSGAGGLFRLRGDHLARIDTERFPWLAQLRSLVQTARGETWLIGRNSISRVASADLERAFADPNAPLPRTEFGARDGLASSMQHGGFSGTQSVAGGDGRVWFLNRQGAAYFDPARLERNRLVPPVAVRALASGGETFRDPSDLVLPPGTRALDVTYAGLSFVVPQRVRFRYRLDGIDDDWVDAGTRRMATYTNLGPGSYRFHVMAANNDGVWNPAGATLDFRIRPTFVQSWPFRLLCAAMVVALLWLAYAMRMRAVAHRIRLRMVERIEERERIARELHDTLLQSVQALTLRFQLAADDLPDKAPARPALIAALDTADRVIAEGRDRVRDLRSREDGDVEQIICDLAARLGFDLSVDIAVTTIGTPRALDALALDEVTRIAGEALFNIRRHADASQVTVDIRHGASFALRFADNGVGIAPELADGGARDGHFGLAGMRERARKLRGTLVIRRLPDRGTELVLTVPGAIAYKDSERGLIARLWSL